jgi:hypothetical protein
VATKVYGVEDFEEADVIFHTVTRVKSACDYEVRLVLRQLIKQAFDDANIDYEPRQVDHITHASNREPRPPVTRYGLKLCMGKNEQAAYPWWMLRPPV